ncbi:MAG: hypothetical protein AB1861_20230 [Cyanobacteriota bacterium]
MSRIMNYCPAEGLTTQKHLTRQDKAIRELQSTSDKKLKSYRCLELRLLLERIGHKTIKRDSQQIRIDKARKVELLKALQNIKTNNFIPPSVEEVLEFGRSIGIHWVTPSPSFPHWFNVLHEIAHWAIKPDWYINVYLEQRLAKKRISKDTAIPYYIPNAEIVDLNLIAGKGLLCSDPLYRNFDPTPNEYAARAWCIYALERNNWCNPVLTEHKLFSKVCLHHKDKDRRYDPEQWKVFTDYRERPEMINIVNIDGSKERIKSLPKDGFEQLKQWGITSPYGSLRPTVAASEQALKAYTPYKVYEYWSQVNLGIMPESLKALNEDVEDYTLDMYEAFGFDEDMGINFEHYLDIYGYS